MEIDALPAYAAGLIDGEGCITINRCHTKNPKWRSKNVRHWIHIIVGMTDREPLELLWKRWGGSLQLRKAKRAEWKNTWIWQIMCYKAYLFLLDIYPYLVAKKLQAELAIKFQETRCRASVKNGRAYELSEEEIRKRDELWQQIKTLNHRGPTRRD